MNGLVLAGYVNAEGLRRSVQDLTHPESFFILEGETQLILGRLQQPPVWLSTRDPATEEAGYLFNDLFELRWQRLYDYRTSNVLIRVRFITDGSTLPDRLNANAWQSTGGEVAHSLPIRYIDDVTPYLWGEYVTGDTSGRAVWYEPQVPRLFDYPVAQRARRVGLRIKTYQLCSVSADDTHQGPGGDPPGFLHRFVVFVPIAD